MALNHIYKPNLALAAQNIAIGTTSAQSAAFNNFTTVVRIIATNACYVVFGTNPTATVANGMYMPAGTLAEYMAVSPGSKLAVIASAAGGTINITEMTL